MRQNVAARQPPLPPVASVSQSVLLPRHQAAGAVLAGDLLVTYGDVPEEYRAATEGAALFDVTGRGLLEVKGPEAGVFLHRLTANDVRGLGVGERNHNLLLTGKGKVQHTFDVLRVNEESYLLSCPPGTVEALTQGLDMYHFTEDLEMVDRSGEHAPIEVAGPGAKAIVEASGAASFATKVCGLDGFRVDAGPEGAEALWASLVEAGGQPVGEVVRDSLRAEHLVAEWGKDIDDNVYPQEARLETAFSLDKGCYIGQEVVAKIDTYGGLNKRLELLRVGHDDPVEPGTRLFREENGEWRDLGVTTTWAYSFALDGGVVLGYVKRKHQEEGTTFRLGDGPTEATIVAAPRA